MLPSPTQPNSHRGNAMCVADELTNFTSNEIQTIDSARFWLEGVFQFIVGSIGIFSNLLAIPILCGRGMQSIFNKLLICLLILHTVYIFSSLVAEAMWQPWENDNPQDSTPFWLIILFSFVLHPLKQLMLFSSIFITILMAKQRYMAIRHPIQYRNTIQSENPWRSAMKSLAIVLTTAGVFTFPLFFETSVESYQVGGVVRINASHFQYVSHTNIINE